MNKLFEAEVTHWLSFYKKYPNGTLTVKYMELSINKEAKRIQTFYAGFSKINKRQAYLCAKKTFKYLRRGKHIEMKARKLAQLSR